MVSATRREESHRTAVKSGVLRRRATLVIAAALGLALGAGPASACGAIFVPRGPVTSGSVPMAQDGEKILFVQDGPDVVQHVQIHYQGDAKQFALVLPTPTLPTVGVGSDRLFSALDAATQPDFVLDVHDEGDCNAVVNEAAGASVARGPAASAADGVQVVSQGQVGPYETAVLRSDDAGALKKWLDANGFVVPANVATLIDPYVANKYFFVALKLQQDRGVGDLQPVALRFAATKAAIPLRMTAIAAAPETNEYVWILGDARAIPENFRHALINEARIDWLSGGSNYRNVVIEACQEAGGQAFVTDYAGDTNGLDLSGFANAKANLPAVVTATAPADFIAQIQSGGYFPSATGGGFDRGYSPNPQLVAFLKRYLPKPATVQENYPDEFYQTLLAASPTEQAKTFAGVTVDTNKAVKDLLDTVLTPAEQIRDLFAKHRYITRLYTTMAPEAMTQDPSFLFNPDLPKVSQHHTAKGTRLCTGNGNPSGAPYLITLNDGTSFRMAQGETGVERNSLVPSMPAAARIELLKTTGGPALIADNGPVISRALASLAVATPVVTKTVGPSVPGASSSPGSAGGGSNPVTAKTTGTAPKNGAKSIGFGCAGCSATNAPPSSRDGAGEGFAYALVILGFWGYRRRQRRR